MVMVTLRATGRKFGGSGFGGLVDERKRSWLADDAAAAAGRIGEAIFGVGTKGALGADFDTPGEGAEAALGANFDVAGGGDGFCGRGRAVDVVVGIVGVLMAACGGGIV